MPDEKKPKVVIEKDGPYRVSGNLPLGKEIIKSGEDGEPIEWVEDQSYPAQEHYDLCRCGQSQDKPYCDQTHLRFGFDGKEIAERKNYLEQAETIEGPDLILTDAKKLCASARFCNRAGGTWKLTRNSDDPKSKAIAIDEACKCPSGRLVAMDKQTKQAIEPQLQPRILLVEDPDKKVSGPIWLKGKVDLESEDGQKYENRNRVTLCRCGHSGNKPFCDGKHIATKFNDGDKSLK